MAQGILTPLQLTAASALLANTGIDPLPTALTTAIASFNAASPIPNFLTAVANYTAASFANATTLTSFLRPLPILLLYPLCLQDLQG